MKLLSLVLFALFQSALFAKPVVVVSILPQKTFVEKIAKERVDVTLMVPQGASPHSYEPKASQMIALSKASIYFSIGVEFEEAWLDKFKSQNSNLKFIDLGKGIEKIQMREHHHHDELEDDPHLWTSPHNVTIMAHTIYNALLELDPNNQNFYKKNLDAFLQEINSTDKKIQKILKDLPKRSFMVFHPSWGYFAKEYKLKQIALEIEGKKPKPKEMIQIIKEAKKEDVSVIFTQPEFSDKSAKTIAKETAIAVKKISPLAPNWSQNLIDMANAIANK